MRFSRICFAIRTRSSTEFDSCCCFFRISRSPRTLATSGDSDANASSSAARRCLAISSRFLSLSLRRLSRGDSAAFAISSASCRYDSANCSTFLWFASSASFSALSAASALSVSNTNFAIAEATCPAITAPSDTNRPAVPPRINPSCVMLLLTARSLNSMPPVEEKKSSIANAAWFKASENLSTPARPTSPARVRFACTLLLDTPENAAAASIASLSSLLRLPMTELKSPDTAARRMASRNSSNFLAASVPAAAPALTRIPRSASSLAEKTRTRVSSKDCDSEVVNFAAALAEDSSRLRAAVADSICSAVAAGAAASASRFCWAARIAGTNCVLIPTGSVSSCPFSDTMEPRRTSISRFGASRSRPKSIADSRWARLRLITGAIWASGVFRADCCSSSRRRAMSCTRCWIDRPVASVVEAAP